MFNIRCNLDNLLTGALITMAGVWVIGADVDAWRGRPQLAAPASVASSVAADAHIEVVALSKTAGGTH
jgi:hypothetical protein